MRSSETPEEEGGREIDMKEGDKSQQWVGGDRKGRKQGERERGYCLKQFERNSNCKLRAYILRVTDARKLHIALMHLTCFCEIH